MAAIAQEHVLNLSVVQQPGVNYRSPQSHCLMYPSFPTPLYPLPSAGNIGDAGLGSNSAMNVLASAGTVLPRRTVAVTTSSTIDQSGSNIGDYQVRTGELIPSPHSYYEVLELLGRGTFGQVLKCWKKDSNEVVAMKILKNLPSYTKQGQVEVDVLTTLSKVDAQQFNLVRAYESFTHYDHICIVFELLNINLYDYLKQNHFQPLPLKHIRPVAQQVLMCLKKLKELGLVHADLKPENIMLVDPDRQPFRVKVIDFGSATVRSSSLSSTYLQSRYYRAPEVILGVPYDEAIDMWSLGCVLAELFLGWPLFPGATEYDQMLYITQMLGPPPTSLTKNVAKMSRFFRKDVTRRRWELKPQVLVKLESGICAKDMRKFIFTSVSGLAQVSSSPSSLSSSQQHAHSMSHADLLDRVQFISLLEMLLTFDPEVRANPETCLQHSFITMLHFSSLAEMPCVKEWLQCMQVCCQSRTSYSSPPIPQHLQLVSPQHLATPTHCTPSLPPAGLCNFSLDMSTSFVPPLNQPQRYLHIPSQFTPMGPPHSTLLVATPTSSALLVDTGYVSADSSPTLHTVWDLPKTGVGPSGQPYPSPVLLPVHTLTAPPPPPYIPPPAAATYWLMLQQQQQQQQQQQTAYNPHSRL